MITMDSLFPPAAGETSDPVLRGVTRGLAQVFEPIDARDLPDHLADLVRRLDERGAGAKD